MLSQDEHAELQALRRRAFGARQEKLTASESDRLAYLSGRQGARTSKAADTTPPPAPATPDIEALLHTDDSTLVEADDLATPRPSRRHRTAVLLASGAAILAVVLAFGGGWFAGQHSTTAVADVDVQSAVSDLRDGIEWDPGTFRIVGMMNGSFFAAGTMKGGSAFCASHLMIGSDDVGEPACVPASEGASVVLFSSLLVPPSADSNSTTRATSALTATTTWLNGQATPAEVSLQESHAQLIDVIATDAFAGWADQQSMAESMHDWTSPIAMIGSVGRTAFWSGTADDGVNTCVVVTADYPSGMFGTCEKGSPDMIDLDSILENLGAEFQGLTVRALKLPTDGSYQLSIAAR